MRAQNYFEIDLTKLQRNLQNLKALAKGKKFLAVVKSNAYGHGLIRCARTFVQAGADWLGVANIFEAFELRQNNILKPILVLNSIAIEDVRLAANQDISIPVFDMEQAKLIEAITFDKPLKIHIKIETGLNRLGFKKEQLSELIDVLKHNKNIVIEGIYSHFAAIEEENFEYAKTQIEEFKEAIKISEKLGIKNVLKHIAASAAVLTIPESHFDMVRCGIALYGLWPSQEIKKDVNNENLIEPVLSFKSEIIHIKKVEAGAKIGYGCAYQAKKDLIIAVIPTGYYDGLDRHLSNPSKKGNILVNGQKCPIIGRICMNMTIVDVTGLDVKIGDEVVIIGKQGNEEITVDEIAKTLGTINYEIIARIPEHLERKYI
jgi:alanine racemase